MFTGSHNFPEACGKMFICTGRFSKLLERNKRKEDPVNRFVPNQRQQAEWIKPDVILHKHQRTAGGKC